MNPNKPAERKRGRSADLSSGRGVKSQPGNGIVPVLVVGMHRSGTSALARTLSLMGVDVGNEDDLLPPHPTDNPTGYWERADIVALHDEFLKSGGYAWNAVGGFNASDLDASARVTLRDGLRKVIGELEQSGHSWLVKDPRLCLLLSQWLPLFDRSACVVVVRDPREIAASILCQELRGAYTSNFLLALWEKYLRSALADLAGKRALFVSYEHLLTNPVHESGRLLRSLNSLGVTGLKDLPESALRAFLDPRLKRSEALLHAELSEAQQALVAWLEAQSQEPSSVVVRNVPKGAAPDANLIEYRKVIEYVTKHSRDRALGDLTTQVSGCVTVTSGTQEQLSALRQEQWELISALRQDQGHMTEQVSALRQEQGSLNADVMRSLGELSEALAERRRLEGKVSELQSEIRRVTAHAESIDAERQDLSARLAEKRGLEERFSELETELKRAIDYGKAVELERRGLSKQVEQLEVTLSSIRSELESTRRSRARALDAAVKIRRQLDAQLSDKQQGDKQIGVDPE
jgi:hypothetical protein